MASTATATLTISPSNSVTGSTHQITVTVTSDCGRGKKATYNLDLQTEPKPSREKRRIRTWTSGTRSDQTGQTTTITEPEPPDDQEHGQYGGPYKITTRRTIPDDSWTMPGLYSGGSITTTYYNGNGTVAQIKLDVWHDMDPSDGLDGLEEPYENSIGYPVEESELPTS